MNKENLREVIHSVQLKAEKALKKAVANVIRDHQRTGDPVVIWSDGKVKRVPASRLLHRIGRH